MCSFIPTATLTATKLGSGFISVLYTAKISTMFNTSSKQPTKDKHIYLKFCNTESKKHLENSRVDSIASLSSSLRQNS